jgi:hypothetical protein
MGSEEKEPMDTLDQGRHDGCIVCWRTPADRAHVIDRSLAPDPGGDPRRVVRLCRFHHTEYDDHRLDLLPYLARDHREKLALGVELIGLIGTLERVTGQAWVPGDPDEQAAYLIEEDVRRAIGELEEGF